MAEKREAPDIVCKRMTKARQGDALLLLDTFLREDEHYLASATVYGDEGTPALKRALTIFLKRPKLGFVWLAYADGEPAGVCFVCYAVSTSIGSIVAKLEDVFVMPDHQRSGVGTAMFKALVRELKRNGVRRIDTAVHRGNRGAERYYRKLGFKPLGEERLSMLL
ncbi:MAG: GNAT family N-acetyltransferase [Pseudomonadota bacterium]